MLALHALDQALAVDLQHIDAEVAERPVAWCRSAACCHRRIVGVIDLPVAVSSSKFAGSTSQTERIQSCRSAIHSVPDGSGGVTEPAAAASGRCGSSTNWLQSSSVSSSRCAGRRRPVPGTSNVGAGPSPSASQATPTPAARASATSRSRLGSASPFSHLRNADGETPIARARRSALGQCARMVFRRSTNADFSAPVPCTRRCGVQAFADPRHMLPIRPQRKTATGWRHRPSIT